MGKFELVYDDIYYYNKDLKYELAKSPAYKYLKLKVQGDKTILSPWDPKKFKASEEKTTKCKRKRPSTVSQSSGTEAEPTSWAPNANATTLQQN